jgi:hypothetical protein
MPWTMGKRIMKDFNTSYLMILKFTEQGAACRQGAHANDYGKASGLSHLLKWHVATYYGVALPPRKEF